MAGIVFGVVLIVGRTNRDQVSLSAQSCLSNQSQIYSLGSLKWTFDLGELLIATYAQLKQLIQLVRTSGFIMLLGSNADLMRLMVLYLALLA